MSALAIELDAVRKRFGTAIALDGATLGVRAGTVHAVLGENGAGKSTLLRVAFGLVRPDAGAVRVNGVAHRFASSADAIRAGLGMVHQHFSLVPAMTVAENVALGGRGRYDVRGTAARVRRVSEEIGLPVDPAARVGSMGVGAQQRVEIVKTLSRDARVLILDEPTAVLAPQEAADLLAWLRRFVEQGRSAVLITHKLREALAVADDVTVLRRGRTVMTVARAEASDAALAAAMLGAPPQQHDAPTGAGNHHPGSAAGGEFTPPRDERDHNAHAVRAAARGDAVIRATNVTLADAAGVVRLSGASLDVWGGEIVGLAGVEGSGQRELLRALAGRLAPLAGTIALPGEVGFVPEDRHHDALLLDFPLVANVALRGAGRRRGHMRWAHWAAETADLLRAFDVRMGAEGGTARALSGGNQQKLVLGRELRGAARAVIVESPSRGLDICATAEVHRRLREERDAGVAVVVYSSDLDEVLLLADRVVVLYGGQLRETARERGAVGRAMLGIT